LTVLLFLIHDAVSNFDMHVDITANSSFAIHSSQIS